MDNLILLLTLSKIIGTKYERSKKTESFIIILDNTKKTTFKMTRNCLENILTELFMIEFHTDLINHNILILDKLLHTSKNCFFC